MRGNLLVVIKIAVVIASLIACTPEPPPYDSRYTPPPPVTSKQAEALPPGASWVDDFNRPNTTLGLGGDWDMRGFTEGDPVLPPATDGFIADGHYASASDDRVYAVHGFRGPIRRIGAEGRWNRTGPGGDETLVIAISANDKLVSDIVQFTATPTSWGVSTRRAGGKYRHVVSGKFEPPLDLDREYRFEMDAADGAITVRVPGAEKSGKVGTLGLLGDRAFWLHYAAPKETPIGAKVAVNMVWVAEQGYPLQSLPPH